MGVSSGLKKGEGEWILPSISTPSIQPFEVLEGIKFKGHR